ncbi:multidrug resistance efflux transporter family protein [Priestia megaterium]
MAHSWNVASNDLGRCAHFSTFLCNYSNCRRKQKVRGSIPLKTLGISTFILAGVILMQVKEAENITLSQFVLGFLPVVMAAFLYPLGNRKMMEVCKGKLDTFQRVLGMAIGSIPLSIIYAIYGFYTTGMPTAPQFSQAFILAMSSGVIATMTFFTQQTWQKKI